MSSSNTQFHEFYLGYLAVMPSFSKAQFMKWGNGKLMFCSLVSNTIFKVILGVDILLMLIRKANVNQGGWKQLKKQVNNVTKKCKKTFQWLSLPTL